MSALPKPSPPRAVVEQVLRLSRQARQVFPNRQA